MNRSAIDGLSSSPYNQHDQERRNEGEEPLTLHVFNLLPFAYAVRPVSARTTLSTAVQSVTSRFTRNCDAS